MVNDLARNWFHILPFLSETGAAFVMLCLLSLCTHVVMYQFLLFSLQTLLFFFSKTDSKYSELTDFLNILMADWTVSFVVD